ncbi:MAG: hypothetical protein P1P85_04765 [Patescibacteria group bacterium]|nr:hypothetical protein [Patescibacteria group bacterium]
MGFDNILLDQFCKTNGSFYILDFEKFWVEKIIYISSIFRLKEEAWARGVQRIVHKNHFQIEYFADQVAHEIEEMIGLS